MELDRVIRHRRRTFTQDVTGGTVANFGSWSKLWAGYDGDRGRTQLVFGAPAPGGQADFLVRGGREYGIEDQLEDDAGVKWEITGIERIGRGELQRLTAVVAPFQDDTA